MMVTTQPLLVHSDMILQPFSQTEFVCHAANTQAPWVEQHLHLMMPIQQNDPQWSAAVHMQANNMVAEKCSLLQCKAIVQVELFENMSSAKLLLICVTVSVHMFIFNIHTHIHL